MEQCLVFTTVLVVKVTCVFLFMALPPLESFFVVALARRPTVSTNSYSTEEVQQAK